MPVFFLGVPSSRRPVVPSSRRLVVPSSRSLVVSLSRCLVVSLSRGPVVPLSRSLVVVVGAPPSHSQSFPVFLSLSQLIPRPSQSIARLPAPRTPHPAPCHPAVPSLPVAYPRLSPCNRFFMHYITQFIHISQLIMR